jgi:hypothetical protein
MMDLQAIFDLTSFERLTKFWGEFAYFWIRKDMNYSSEIKGSPGVLVEAPSGTSIS